MPKIDETRLFLAVNIAVLTVSDTRVEADDRSGQALVELIARDGHALAARKIVKDIKQLKLKVQAQIMDDKVRVTGKKLDELQQVMAYLKENGPKYPLQFVNLT